MEQEQIHIISEKEVSFDELKRTLDKSEKDAKQAGMEVFARIVSFEGILGQWIELIWRTKLGGSN